MRYLFVTVDSAGGLYPQLALAQRARARGHQVRFLACRSQRSAIREAGFRVRTYIGPPDFDMGDRDGAIRDWEDDPAAAFQACCDHIWFGPAAAVAGHVVEEVQREPVDALAIDYFAFGAAIAAERLGLPATILWHTCFGEWSSWNAGLPAINAARAGLGLPSDTDVYGAYHRAARVLVFTTERFGLAIGGAELPANVRHVGPQLAPGADPGTTTGASRGTPSVLVSLSTSYQAQEGLLARAALALGGLGVKALVTTGPAVRVEQRMPPNVEVRPWVNHSDVLSQTDLVVTHGGLGTVMTAMAHGVPLLCLPMGRDQHGNAARAERLGCGRTADASSGVDDLRQSIARALADPSLRTRAQELAAECDPDAGVIELQSAARQPIR